MRSKRFASPFVYALPVSLALVACGPAQRSGSPQDPQDPHVPLARDVPLRDVTRVERVDVLFVVDDSGSMREEQDALREQLPRMVTALSSGDVDGDGEVDFPPPDELRMGVVSSDMGLPAIDGIPGCAGLGGDALLIDGAGRCEGDVPEFVTYRAGDDPERAGRALGCVAELGTEGCGFEQPLEAALKALWPADDDRVRFLDAAAAPVASGHGRADNAAFTAGGDGDSPSLLVVVMLTDEEDCSSAVMRHFTPDVFLPPDDPLFTQDLNLRCFYNPDNLYPVERYVRGLKLLREGAEQLVLFAAIAGVPPDLVDARAMAEVDMDDATQREELYDRVLADPRMQERPDPDRAPEQGGNLLPSCETDTGRAFPPRRIVEVARRFGANGVVQSMCQSDFRPVVAQLLQRIAARMRDPSGA